MTSLSLPDINVWLAIASPEHTHFDQAAEWWASESNSIAFCRFTQMGLHRLTTTAAAMDGKPLSLEGAWQVYERFFEDERVIFLGEPERAGQRFRTLSTRNSASPKVIADAWLLSFAHESGGTLVTFDRALAGSGAKCLL
jgi:toxin-antitoxin system PIN domain toxin